MSARVTTVALEVFRSTASSYPVSGSTTVTLSYTGSEGRTTASSATTTVTFSYTATAHKTTASVGATTFTFSYAGVGHKTTSSAAATTVTFSYAGSENRAASSTASTTVTMSYAASGPRWVYPAASTLVLLSYLANENRTAVASALNNFTAHSSCLENRTAYPAGTTTITFSPSTSANQVAVVAAATAMTFSGTTTEATTWPVSAATTITLAGSASETRWVTVAGVSTFSFSVSCLPGGHAGNAVSTIGFDGTANANRISSISASSAVLLEATGLAPKTASPTAATTMTLTSVFQDIRTLDAEATTAIRLRGTGQNLIGPIGGNPMSAQYVGYLGQYQQGQTATLMLRSVGYRGQLVTPDGPPVASIYDDSGASQTFLLPASDQANNIFSLPIFLGLTFPLGRYRVSYRYSSGGTVSARADFFEVIPGGDPGGAVISVFAYDRPEAGYVLAQLGSGMLVQGRNPRI